MILNFKMMTPSLGRENRRNNEELEKLMPGKVLVFILGPFQYGGVHLCVIL